MKKLSINTILDYKYRDISSHKIKSLARSRKWAKEHPERAFENNFKCRLKRKYGMTIDLYNALLEKQNRGCAICFKTREQNVNRKQLAVDHSHTTGKVRGLLCDKCNRGIGYLREDLNILRRAIQYLSEVLC